MKHGSLFSGIGGFDLAAEWMGWQNIFHCEWMPFPQKVLKHYWPGAISYHDITITDFRQHAGQLDILTGGFPCQPYSAAGKRLGKDDERHLWPHMLRAIREISPRWVVGENVRGLTNWNGGVVFDEVQADLESAGYEVLPFLLPAVAVNAPHRRDRIWFIAYAKSNGNNRGGQCRDNKRESSEERIGPKFWNQFNNNGKVEITAYADGMRRHQKYEPQQTELSKQYGKEWDAAYADYKERIGRCDSAQPERSADGQERQRMVGTASRYGEERDATDARSAELQGCIQHRGLGSKRAIKADGRQPCGSVCTTWQNFPTQSPICGGDDGLPTELDGITFPKWRAESIKGYGNAIVPQVALQIFKAIEQYEAVTMPHSSPRSQTHKE